MKTIEEQIFELKFKGSVFDPNDFRDWAMENEREAYTLCLQVANNLLIDIASLKSFLY